MEDATILTAEMFAPHLGSQFSVAVAGYEDALTLSEVEPLRSTMPGAIRAPFSLVFDGARTDIVFDQQVLDMRHAVMGALPVMVTPIGRLPDGRAQYQAMFN